MTATLVRFILLACSGAATLAFVLLAVRRLIYPLELDGIEGVMMDHVVRLSEGQSIYVEPSLQFIPLASMPGFATLASLFARLFGPSFWELRVISLVSILLTAYLAMRIVERETSSRMLGVASAGILFMAFGVTGGAYDVGRADSLMLCLVVAALSMVRFSTGVLDTLGAALLLTLAFFTQQQAIWFVLAVIAHLVVNDRKQLLWLAPAVMLGCVGGYLLLSRWLGPWFFFYTLDVPWRWSDPSHARLLHYLGGLVGTLGLLAAPALLSLCLPERPWRRATGLWVWAALGAVGCGLTATLDREAIRHVLNPTVVTLAILGPISIARVVRHLSSWPGSQREGRTTVAFAVLALQFLPLAYAVRAQIPRPRAEEAHAELMRRLRDEPGPVLMPYHGFYTWSAGKGTWLQQKPLEDVLRARGNRLLQRDPEFFERMFEPLRSGPDRPMIVTDVPLERSGSESQPLWASVASGYRLEGDLGSISQDLDPLNDHRWTPRYIYVPVAEEALNPPADPEGRRPRAAEGARARGPAKRT